MRQVRLETTARLSDREGMPITVATVSGLGVERQRQVEARLAGDLAAVEKKNSLTKLLTKKQGQLETQKKALEDANKKLSDTTVMQDRVASRAAIETHAGNIASLEAEVENLKRMLS